jgi:pyrroloquinoline quinone (PQQ) biosynthesis protein C
MQDAAIQAQAQQPFVKLAQANMELFTRFSTSPQVTAQAGSLLQQVSESAMGLMRSGAFAQIMQGLLKNYTEFMIDLNQTTLTLLSQGQATLVRQAQEATESVVDMTDVRGRRPRHAA